MYLRSKHVQSFSIILILTVSLVSLFSMTVPYPGGFDFWKAEFTIAQLTNNNIIQITSTSSFIDDFGNFHVIGEVNNTSTQPQSNIVITAILSDTNNNLSVGNHSAFSSISNLRQGELSPFDIVVQDPQILGKFNFMEFSTTSQPAIEEKPANLVLNGSSSFVDNVGDPHITGNIINQGQSPEQFLNLVATFYDNSSLGVVGTQSFGLNVGSLENNQMAPFDISITDNKTKSQTAFYSINVDSAQSSMNFPLNPKFPFASLGGFVDSGLFLNSPLSANPLPSTVNEFNSNNNNNNNDQLSSSGSNNDDSDGSDSLNNDLEIDIDIAKDPIGRGDLQTIGVSVSDSDTDDAIAGANVDGTVKYATNRDYDTGNFNEDTDNDGKVEHTWRIGGGSDEGTFNVIVKVDANGYNSQTETTTFEVVDKDKLNNSTEEQDNSTSLGENSTTLDNESQEESNGDLDCADVDERNFQVESNDPNNFDGDNDGIGCETEEGNDDQTNNDEEEEPKTDDETTREILEGIDGTVIGGTTGDSSDSGSEQTDRDGDGVSNEQPSEEGGSDGNDSENEEQDDDSEDNDDNEEENN
ncbi:hypothetical protein NMY3_00357 [Candidatus Nitrosocosmicus oleophilus]|uniref:Uncharacterized protein n=2 Tax=Candidatus Nitrosocosmicus oleophilus TaxID=1353260 RepID=A0A654LWE9_9ARCH|nr:hypothetical protein NMY3_00357 [Candidatus Nitrosocosmicus oleophilus]